MFDSSAVARTMTSSLAQGIKNLMNYRSTLSAVKEKAIFLDVSMKDLVKDPEGTVAQIYKFYGIDFDDHARQTVVDYCAANPRSNHPNRHATVEFIGTDERQVEKEFAEYIEKYSKYFWTEVLEIFLNFFVVEIKKKKWMMTKKRFSQSSLI